MRVAVLTIACGRLWIVWVIGEESKKRTGTSILEGASGIRTPDMTFPIVIPHPETQIRSFDAHNRNLEPIGVRMEIQSRLPPIGVSVRKLPPVASV